LTVLETIESAYVTGRGANLPMAIEATLKLKEVVLLHAEATVDRPDSRDDLFALRTSSPDPGEPA
jgi:hypothetical protein